MKKLTLILALLLPMLLVSCEFEEKDLGFPGTVTFTKDGGEQVITGKSPITNANIHNYKNGDQGQIQESETGEIFVYDWLKIEYQDNNNSELKIYAEPNDTQKTRELNIEIYFGTDYQSIKVKQH